ncbi:MAG TPA: DUF4012 domain-containing protein [Acidimicrobiales bacterium]
MTMVLRRRTLFTTRRSRTVSFGVAVGAAALGGALLTTAHPTGMTTADAIWSGALVAIMATFGATARRWTWFLPAGVAAAIAGDGLATVLAAVAIVIAFVSVLRDTRSRARGAAVVALGTIALLRAEPIGFHGLTALVMVAAATPVLVTGYAHAGRRVQSRARRVALVAGGLIGLMLVGAALGVVSVQGNLIDGGKAIDGGLAAARDADDDTAAAELGQAARQLTAADSTLSSWFVAPARTLPIVGPNIAAVGELAAQAGEVADVTSQAASNADVDSLRFVGGRLDPQAVANMRKPLENVKSALERMQTSVDDIDSPWLLTPIANRIHRLDDQIDDVLPDADMAINAVAVGPTLLGADGPQRYLVLFTTPVEARGRVGFPGNFAELTVTDGKLDMTRFGRISELEQGGVPGDQRTLAGPPDYVARYSRFDVAATWRNVTMSPDFPSVAKVVADLYPQSGGAPLNGVMAVDPQGLAALMRYTGPVQVEGLDQPLTNANAAQYLLSDQYSLFDNRNTQRIDVLEQVARTTFDRLTSADLPGPRALGDQLDPIVDGGHIQFTTTDVTTALPLFVAGINGQIPTPRDDLANDTITLTTANAAANKADLFLHRSESYDITWDPETGKVTGTLHVTLKNDTPTSGLPTYVIGNAVGLPVGSNRSFVSVYSLFDLDAARMGGQPASMQSETELDRHVYSTFVDIPPGGTADIELDLSGTLERSHTYRLDIPAQPFASPDQVAVNVTVAGKGPIAASHGGTVEDRTARWSQPLDRALTLTVSAARP